MVSVVDNVTVESIYGHLSKLNVVAGQKVSRGDTIGLVGETGDATGFHLHIEIRNAKNPFVDPRYTGE